MPTPHPGSESRDEWMDRCIPQVLDDGTADSREQAVAICSSMWDDAKQGPGEEREYKQVRILELKAADDHLGTFSGYGAVFGNEDAQGDVIQTGAFAESLTEWKKLGKWPPMLLQHGGLSIFGGGNAIDLLPVGVWKSMVEDRRGLRVEGQLFALDTERGRYIYEGLKADAFDGLSIGYKTREFIQGTRPGEPDRILTSLDLKEVSLVTFPANPLARVTTVKSLSTDEQRELTAALRDAGVSRKDCPKAVWAVKQWLQRDAGELRGQRDAAAAGGIRDVLEACEELEGRLVVDALQTMAATLAAGGRR